METKDDHVRRALVQLAAENVARAALEDIIVVPRVVPQNALRHAIGEPQKPPALGLFHDHAKRVDLAVMGQVFRPTAGKTPPSSDCADPLGKFFYDKKVGPQ